MLTPFDKMRANREKLANWNACVEALEAVGKTHKPRPYNGDIRGYQEFWKKNGPAAPIVEPWQHEQSMNSLRD